MKDKLFIDIVGKQCIFRIYLNMETEMEKELENIRSP